MAPELIAVDVVKAHKGIARQLTRWGSLGMSCHPNVPVPIHSDGQDSFPLFAWKLAVPELVAVGIVLLHKNAVLPCLAGRSFLNEPRYPDIPHLAHSDGKSPVTPPA